jgi:integrase
MQTATDKRGRTYERRRRPLSNTSINMLITLLGQILQQAVDYELIDRNPVRVGGPAARFLKRARPDRTFLEVDEFLTVLNAAGELEAEAPANRKGLGRRAMVATLGLAGFRIGEMMDLKVAQVDLQRCRFKLADAKTEAGVREVEITLYLRDELLAYAMDRRARGLPHGPADHFFGTATGRRRDPDRFRDRILARAVARANATRAESGLAPLPAITPHSLRRTWATFCAMIGRDPKWVAAQIGHVNPKFTFSVYQQVATRRYIDEQAVWALMRSPTSPPSALPAARSPACSRAPRADSRPSTGASLTGSSTVWTTARRTAEGAVRAGGFNGVINGTARNPAFDAAARYQRHQKTPRLAGLFLERLKGLEPSTFCMARVGRER